MKLRSLKVEQFAGLNPGAELTDLHERITVISGPNEAGKSTLFRGLIYALYQRHTTGGQEAAAEIVPAGTSLHPRVQAVIDVGGDTFRITKQFIKSRSAMLEQLREGVFTPVAQDTEADEKLRELLGSGVAQKGLTRADLRGIGEVLIVDQGAMRLRALSALTKDRLRAVIQQVGMNGATHGLMQRVHRKYQEIFTDRGDFRSGQGAPAFVVAKRQLDEVRQELEQVRGRIAEAEQLEARLADAPIGPSAEEKAEYEEELRLSMTAELEAVRYDEQLKALQDRIDSRRAQADALRSTARDIDASLQSLESGRQNLATLQAEHAREQEAREKVAEALHAADALMRELSVEESRIQGEEAAFRDAAQARQLIQASEDLHERLARWDGLKAQVTALHARLTERPRPTGKELASLRKDLGKLAEIERDLLGLSLRVTVRAAADVSLTHEGSAVQLKQGESRLLSGRDPLVVGIAGVGTFTIEGPPAPQRDKLMADRAAVEKRITQVTEPYGTRDLGALEVLEQERTSVESELGKKEAACAALFADEAALRQARERLGVDQARLRVVLDKHPEWNGKPPSEEHLASLEQTARESRRRFADLRASREGMLKVHREDLQRRDASLRAREQKIHALAVQVAQLDVRVQEARRDGVPDEERAERAAALEAEVHQHEEKMEELRRVRDQLGEPAAASKRARNALDELSRQEREIRDERVRLETMLDELRATGLWDRLGQLEAEEQRLEEIVQRGTLEAEALRQLHTLLQEEQARAVDLAVKPVRDRVERMMRQVVGGDARPAFDETLLPTSIHNPHGATISVDLLSAGTQDQLALLTRLAFGELYANEKGRHAFVLDDPLVNTHRERRNRILDILVRASDALQIIIFTCHPEHYRGLSEKDARYVTMDDVKLRPT